MDPITRQTIDILKSQTQKTTFDLIDDCAHSELSDLYDKKLNLIKPIPIDVRFDSDDHYFSVIQEQLNLWSDASTLNDALKEVAYQIASLFKRLASINKDALGPIPNEQLTYLKKFIS